MKKQPVWNVSRKPGTRGTYVVYSRTDDNKIVIADTFKSMKKAREFCSAANEMLGRKT